MPKLNSYNLAGFLAVGYQQELEGHQRTMYRAERDGEKELVDAFGEVCSGLSRVVALLEQHAAKEPKDGEH